jgi:hypothetical protein
LAQQHKLILAILVSALGGMWIGYSLDSGSRDYKDQRYTSQHATSSAITTDTLNTQLQQQIQQLQSDNSQLLQQLQAQSTQQTTSSTLQQNAKADDVDQQLHNKLQDLEMEKQQRKADDFGAWAMDSQKANRNFDVNSELSQRFAQESRDPVWAEQQENHYQQLFSNQEELRDFALRNAECRSTQCEVTVSVSNSEQSQQLLQTMSRALQGSVVLVATDEKSSTSKLYIGRDEKSFEFN